MTNASEFAKFAQPEHLTEFHVCNVEFLMQKLMPIASKKAGKRIDKHTVIMDLSGLGFSHLNLKALSLLKSLSDLDQAYYPEILHRLFVVNAPYIFTSLWSMVKLWLDERVLKKIFVLKQSEMKNVLLEYIDSKSLPEMYGGECTCDTLGGCVPISAKNN